jgi:hypothetical protein
MLENHEFMQHSSHGGAQSGQRSGSRAQPTCGTRLPNLYHRQNFQGRVRTVMCLPEQDDFRSSLASEECTEMAEAMANLV